MTDRFAGASGVSPDAFFCCLSYNKDKKDDETRKQKGRNGEENMNE
jgi:hypothetical protein